MRKKRKKNVNELSVRTSLDELEENDEKIAKYTRSPHTCICEAGYQIHTLCVVFAKRLYVKSAQHKLTRVTIKATRERMSERSS